MEQSKNSSTNRQSGRFYAAPSKDFVDTAIAAGNLTTLMPKNWQLLAAAA
jgi:hypothetical protein